GVTVHDEMRRRAPELLEPLYRGYCYHRLGEEGPDEEPATPYRVPVFASRNGDLSVRYQRSGIAAGHKQRQRRLIRLWLDAPGFRHVPKGFNLFKANGVPPQPGKRASFDFKKLYAEDPVATGGIPKIDA